MVITSSIPAARIRVATSYDVDAIMKALKELSDEIPVHMDTEAQMNCIRNNVTECCRECSWVTRDDAGHIVGFLLGKTQTDSGLRESNGQWVDRGLTGRNANLTGSLCLTEACSKLTANSIGFLDFYLKPKL